VRPAGRSPRGTISASELLERIRTVVEERRRAGSPAPPPQPLSAAEPDAIAASDAFPWRSPAGRGAAPAPPTGALILNDFLELHPERFVVRCYHALLARDPGEEELRRWARRVAGGVWRRPLALVAIRWSREGRARGVPVRFHGWRFVRDGARYALQRARARWRRA
jgi:hypothetical protein